MMRGEEHFQDIKMKNDIDAIIKNSSAVTGKILFIINCGLHYNDLDRLNRTLWKFLPLMVKYAEMNHTVIFRENSAQHFQTADGRFIYKSAEEKIKENIPKVSSVSLIVNKSRIFSENTLPTTAPEVQDNNLNKNTGILEMNTTTFPHLDYRCARIKSMEMLKKQNWRNDMAISILKHVDINNRIGIARFYIMTAARYDYHVASYGDRTHYCFGPMIWAPVWDYTVNYYVTYPILCRS